MSLQVWLTVFLFVLETSIYFTFSTASPGLLQYIWNHTKINQKEDLFKNYNKDIVASSLPLEF